MPDAHSAAPPEQADVAIVGAGVAGLYCAWRLLLQDPARSVVVIDRLPRVGGRLDTDLVRLRGLDRFDDDGTLIPGETVVVKEEEGGMRFNSAMPELLSLIDALGLWDEIVPFGMGDDENLFHVRGRSFTAGESKKNNDAIWSTLYDLRPAERNKSPGEIIMAVYHDLVLANGDLPPEKPTPEYWQQFRLDFRFQGRGLNQWGLWSLLRAMGLSDECITMLADTTGFQGPFLGPSSAGCALQILEDFPLDPRFFALRYGFGSLPQALRGQIERLGGVVRLSTGAEAVERMAEGGFSLRLGGPGGAGTLVAGKVILALSPFALRRLQEFSPALREGAAGACLRRAGASLIENPLCKVNLYYDHAWWRDRMEGPRPQVRNGGCFTTQPLGAVYAFDPLATEDANGPAALTIYSDFVKTEFWRQLQEVGGKFDSPAQREHDADRPQVLFAASEAVVAEATAQLRDLFRMLALPRPVLTSYRMWSGDNEFGFAYHQWARGVDDRAVMRDIACPAEGLFVCNEAFSDDQGWVNGSLRSADRVLQGWFGAGAPPPANKLLPGNVWPSAPVRKLREKMG
jgi:hypothetical protein